MSLNNIKVVSKLEEVTLEDKAKVIVNQKVIDQIEHLHKIVGAIEWSGILVYKIVEGSIEAYKDLVIEVTEILPMDVGSAGYTEYEINASSDDYTFDNVSRVMMDDDLKMGHIHTHHNMTCYFSGTDMQELHDNTPNHNYYLSLIVNFKNYTNWCAKVCFIGEETQEGTISKKYKGSNGEYITETQDIKQTEEILFMIDTDIVVEEVISVSQEFYDRVGELKKDAGNKFTHVYKNQSKKSVTLPADSGFPGWEIKNGQWVRVAEDNKPGMQGKQTTLFTEKKELMTGNGVSTTAGTKPAEKIVVNTETVTKFITMVVAQDEEPIGDLAINLATIESMINFTSETYEADKELYISSVSECFDSFFEQVFKTTPTLQSADFVAKKAIKILKEKGEIFDIVDDIIEDLDLQYVIEN